MDYGLDFDQKRQFKVKSSWWIFFFFFLQTAFCFIRHYLMDWSCVDYLWIILMFLSAVWTHILTAPIQLQIINWWASDLMLHFSKSVPIKKQTHLHLGWPEGDLILKSLQNTCRISLYALKIGSLFAEKILNEINRLTAEETKQLYLKHWPTSPRSTTQPVWC